MVLWGKELLALLLIKIPEHIKGENVVNLPHQFSYLFLFSQVSREIFKLQHSTFNYVTTLRKKRGRILRKIQRDTEMVGSTHTQRDKR